MQIYSKSSLKKVAVVLFNLGGPDGQASVRPFLFNLFNDKAIIDIPQPFRWLLAKLVSFKRAASARLNYAELGGGSPILRNTLEQASALELHLNLNAKAVDYQTFVCMRYWHPMTEEVVVQVREGGFDEVVLLPLYPQFSTTTTASSLNLWQKTAAKYGLSLPTRAICCYPNAKSLVLANANVILQEYSKCSTLHEKVRILFSAHGLPQKIIDNHDPYQHQVELTVAAMIESLSIDSVDYAICYQSKVGPLKWLEPSLEQEMKRAAQDQVAVLVVPISFVSEHVETLVELDIEYRELAHSLKVPGYFRVKALGTNCEFIAALAELVLTQNVKKSCLDKHKCYLRSC